MSPLPGISESGLDPYEMNAILWETVIIELLDFVKVRDVGCLSLAVRKGEDELACWWLRARERDFGETSCCCCWWWWRTVRERKRESVRVCVCVCVWMMSMWSALCGVEWWKREGEGRGKENKNKNKNGRDVVVESCMCVRVTGEETKKSSSECVRMCICRSVDASHVSGGSDRDT